MTKILDASAITTLPRVIELGDKIALDSRLYNRNTLIPVDSLKTLNVELISGSNNMALSKFIINDKLYPRTVMVRSIYESTRGKSIYFLTESALCEYSVENESIVNTWSLVGGFVLGILYQDSNYLVSCRNGYLDILDKSTNKLTSIQINSSLVFYSLRVYRDTDNILTLLASANNSSNAQYIEYWTINLANKTLSNKRYFQGKLYGPIIGVANNTIGNNMYSLNTNNIYQTMIDAKVVTTKTGQIPSLSTSYEIPIVKNGFSNVESANNSSAREVYINQFKINSKEYLIIDIACDLDILHSEYKITYNNDGTQTLTMLKDEQKFANGILSTKLDDNHYLISYNSKIEIYKVEEFNNLNNSILKLEKIINVANIKQFGVDGQNNFWIMKDNLEVRLEDVNTAARFDLVVPESIDFDSNNLTGDVKLQLFNARNELIVRDCKLSIVGNAKFTDNNSNEIEVTTLDTGYITKQIIATGKGLIKINVNFT